MALSACMQDRVAVVTGAGNGIGRAIALGLARNGAAVVVNDIGTSLGGEGRSDGPAHAVVREIEAAGGRAVASLESVADPAGAERTIRLAVAAFGRLDALVNNAGILRDRIFHKLSTEEWDAVLRVHLHGSFHMSRAAAAVFREQGSGSFVHMTSGAGLIGNVGQANYGAAKLGIVGLSRCIALDMHRAGVRSNCVAPVAWSRMTASIPAETPEARALAAQRRAEMDPAKVAPLVAYLASEASAHVTGQIFGVRGDEILVYSQPRALARVRSDAGWTVESIAATAMPRLDASLTPLETTVDVSRAAAA